MAKNNWSRAMLTLVGSILLVNVLREVFHERQPAEPCHHKPPPPSDPSTADWRLARYSVRREAPIAVAVALVVFFATIWLVR